MSGTFVTHACVLLLPAKFMLEFLELIVIALWTANGLAQTDSVAKQLDPLEEDIKICLRRMDQWYCI